MQNHAFDVTNFNEALGIMLRGLMVVFLVMGLIAGTLWLSGKYFVAKEAKEKARLKAEEEKKKAAEAAAKTTDGDDEGGA